jgi:hypothetical protein
MLSGVKTIKQNDEVHGFKPRQDDGSVQVHPGDIVQVGTDHQIVQDGK